MQSIEHKIEEIIAPPLEAMGYEALRIRVMGGDHVATLQIMVDRLDGERVSIDACATISHTISALMDVHDPIKGAYQLEVSSAGIDRPLVRKEHYERALEQEIKLETLLPMGHEARRKFRGVLKAVQGDVITLVVDKEEVEIELAAVKSAQLMMSENLMKKPKKPTSAKAAREAWSKK